MGVYNMAGTSRTTTAYALRLPNEVAEILERRVSKNPKLGKVQDYIKDRIIIDALRKR